MENNNASTNLTNDSKLESTTDSKNTLTKLVGSGLQSLGTRIQSMSCWWYFYQPRTPKGLK